MELDTNAAGRCFRPQADVDISQDIRITIRVVQQPLFPIYKTPHIALARKAHQLGHYVTDLTVPHPE